jgi:hypothetical protein
MASHGHDGFGSTPPCFEATVFCAERAFAVGGPQQTEAVQFLNPLAIQRVGLGSARHMFDMTCIDHPDLEASN